MDANTNEFKLDKRWIDGIVPEVTFCNGNSNFLNTKCFNFPKIQILTNPGTH